MTPWAPLQNYNVKWSHSVNLAVQMDVHRGTGHLLHNELKLVVMQVSLLSCCAVPQRLPSPSPTSLYVPSHYHILRLLHALMVSP